MADHTLAQAAEITGESYAALKKKGQRGQLRITTTNGRVTITEEDLEAYMATETFRDLHKRTQGEDMAVVAREAGNMIGRLPSKVRGAILDGMPVTKRGGSLSVGDPEPFRKATKGMNLKTAVPSASDDPHFDFEVGYAHSETPRWKHVSAQQWKLGAATWTYSPDPKGNGGVWIGGGSRVGRSLAPNFSPANPYSDLRPVAGSESSDRD